MDELSREGLRELLLDVAPPDDVREDMFAQTFADGSEGAGADLLPPDGWYDADPDGLEDPLDDLGDTSLDNVDPFGVDPADEVADYGVDHGVDYQDVAADLGIDHGGEHVPGQVDTHDDPGFDPTAGHHGGTGFDDVPGSW